MIVCISTADSRSGEGDGSSKGSTMADMFRFNRDLEAALASANGEQPLAGGRRDPTPVTVQVAFAALQSGNATFAKGLGSGTPGGFPDLEAAWRKEIANDHIPDAEIAEATPRAAILCCSDHRASPDLIFWQGLGRLFVIRDAGNLLDDHGTGSLEYALAVLKVPLIVILGHVGCGAVLTAISTFQEGRTLSGTMLPRLIERFGMAWAGRPGGNPIDETWLSHASLARTKTEIEQIPMVKDRLDCGNLAIVTGRYDVESGVVSWIGATPLPPPPPAI